MYYIITAFIIGIIIGVIIGFFGAKMWLQKILKNNFPINEEFIDTFLSGIGKTPTKKQTKNILEKLKKEFK